MPSVPSYDLSVDEMWVGISIYSGVVLKSLDNGTSCVSTPNKKRERRQRKSEQEMGGSNKKTRGNMFCRSSTIAQEELSMEKESTQMTALVGIDIRPRHGEQDLIALWKKVTEKVNRDGLQWGESCSLGASASFGVKKIQCTFVTTVQSSNDEIVDDILSVNEVESCEITSMNIL